MRSPPQKHSTECFLQILRNGNRLTMKNFVLQSRKHIMIQKKSSPKLSRMIKLSLLCTSHNYILQLISVHSLVYIRNFAPNANAAYSYHLLITRKWYWGEIIPRNLLVKDASSLSYTQTQIQPSHAIIDTRERKEKKNLYHNVYRLHSVP